MSKYKVGDKFIVEIEEIYNGDLVKHEEHMHLHRIKGFNSLVLDEYGLDKLQQINPKLKIEDIDDMLAEYDLKKESYEKGLEVAWELARKINNDFNTTERAEIFNFVVNGITVGDILNDFTPQEALAKLEAYEESKQIQVGDVVFNAREDVKAIIMDDAIAAGAWQVYTENGCVELWKECEFKKTGKRVDISSILEQIRGNE